MQNKKSRDKTLLGAPAVCTYEVISVVCPQQASKQYQG